MCGKYILAQAAKAEKAMGIRRNRWEYPTSYRVLPSEPVPVVVNEDGERSAQIMRWGLVPYWAHGVPLKASTINATAERMQSAPTYRDAWRRAQRCILVMAGFYEPHVNEDGSRDPFFVHLNDREVFGVAGLWDRSPRQDGTVLTSCTLITLPANRLLAEIHNEKQRMPAVLAAEAEDAWLGADPAAALAALKPYPDEYMVGYRVSRRVNSPRLPNEASLIEPASEGQIRLDMG